jgi:hypothetical protein
MKTQFMAFRAVPASVGSLIAHANGALGKPLYWPVPAPHYLNPVSLRVAVLYKNPPAVSVEMFEDMYYARDWSPSRIKAQPPHRTTWSVTGHGVKAVATARLWLDLKKSSLEHNGGFPRVKENWLRGAFIQGFWPQFNARLIPTPPGLAALAAATRGRVNE